MPLSLRKDTTMSNSIFSRSKFIPFIFILAFIVNAHPPAAFAEQASQSSQTVVLDTWRPEVSIISPQNNAVISAKTADVSVYFKGHVWFEQNKWQLNAVVRQVFVKLDGKIVAGSDIKPPLKEGTKKFQIDISKISEGKHQLQAFAYQGILIPWLEGKSTPVSITIQRTAPVNHPPQITSSPVTTAKEGQAYRYQVQASDPDSGDILTYTLTTQPAGMSMNSTGLITWTPTYDQAGNANVSVKVTDKGGLSATQSFTIAVQNTNRPPVAVIQPVQASVTVGTAVNLDGSASSDPDADALSYKWTLSKPNGSAAALSNAAIVNPSFTPDVAGSYGVQLIVNDGTVDSSAVSVTIRAEKPVPPPQPLPPDPSTVAPPIDRTVATTVAASTQFLYSGDNLIQTGVVNGTINPIHAGVIRGKVLQEGGAALSGVTITILGHQEFGRTLSRTDGMFDMTVNGGGLLTVSYQKDGYLSLQRQINVPWNDFAIVDDVIMIPVDPQVTSVDFAGSSQMQTARGSQINDADGTRQAVLLFAPGTQATAVKPDGTTISLSSAHVRATEYTAGQDGPKKMPAPLPPASAYTYCAEFSVDEALAAGAQDVRFNKPVIVYIDNFLNFPVGGNVPTGYYDRSRGAWIPSDNGVIIKILSITGGMADIDIKGTGAAASSSELTALGITDAERLQLASLYGAGHSLWRISISHFSPWDCNWAFSPPPDAQPPVQPDPIRVVLQKDDCHDDCGSIIQTENQNLGEAIHISGTPFDLYYQSERTPGRIAGRSMNISISGPSVPSDVKRIDLEVSIAGQQITQSFPAAPNQMTTFIWDGKNAYGQKVQGSVPVSVKNGYVYDAFYSNTPRFGYNGNGTIISGSRTRNETTLSQRNSGFLYSLDSVPQGLGGWSLSVHHSYDCANYQIMRHLI